jgi:hypothetical protein
MNVHHSLPILGQDDFAGEIVVDGPAETSSDSGDLEWANSERYLNLVFGADGRPRLFVLIEQILKNRARLHQLIRVPTLQEELIPRFLAISLAGFFFFGVVACVVFNAAAVWPELTPVKAWLSESTSPLIAFHDRTDESSLIRWLDSLALIAAYSLGLVAATGICVPTLYFYGLLSGIRMTILDVTIHALKAKATAAVALVGILPIYAAISLGMIVFEAPASLIKMSLLLGLVLPFIAGFWGTYSLYVGFAGLCDTLPLERRERRECFLRRLVLSWAACYSAVMPVMIFTLWQSFAA